jgi:YD repeat-containing protein
MGGAQRGTDSEGWSVTYDYDVADRVTKVTYPDGTTDQCVYDKLDLASYRDRQGRVWTYTHDADRRLTSVTDPAGQQTQYVYNDNG